MVFILPSVTLYQIFRLACFGSFSVFEWHRDPLEKRPASVEEVFLLLHFFALRYKGQLTSDMLLYSPVLGKVCRREGLRLPLKILLGCREAKGDSVFLRPLEQVAQPLLMSQ